MTDKLVIITLPEIGLKLVNKLLLSLRDWEFGAEPYWDMCKILRTIDQAVNPPSTIDKPPFQSFIATEFQAKSIQDIEALMLPKYKAGHGRSVFLILDEQGVKDETIILLERRINSDEATKNDRPYLDIYNKVRVPWIQSHVMWCNLLFEGMSFKEFCEESESSTDEWFTHKQVGLSEGFNQHLRWRDRVLRELAKLDLA